MSSKGTLKVLVTDPIAQEGLELLQKAHQINVELDNTQDELIAKISEYDALIVRSETQVTRQVIEAGKNLQVIGRAGVGVDNIDVDCATAQGIVVVNAPTSNTFSAAEHTLALMLAMARQIPQAHSSLKDGNWHRSKFVGTELRGKTLGIIGLGRVGTEVAQRARGFEMRILGSDPYVSPEHAKALGIEVASLETVYKEADFITVHTALTDSTRGLIARDELNQMKKGVRLLNVARGGIINEKDLEDALKADHVAAAAIDVFSVEPVTDHPLFEFQNMIATPHLGASTIEAQTNVSIDVAQQVIDVFAGQPPRYAVNVPLVPTETLAVLQPYVDVARYVGNLAGQILDGLPSKITIRYAGDLAQHEASVLKASLLGGFLANVSEERVTIVNADLIALNRGLQITESKEPADDTFNNLVTAEITTNEGITIVSGTMIRGQTHIVRINDYWLEMVPNGAYWLIMEHTDRPGMIGNIGTITGENDINISTLQLSRLEPRGPAMTVLGIDQPISDEQMELLQEIQNVSVVRRVEL
ncbi:MAG: phosphoglycerate dehydrogenase [SAR202 cluster bacterium]|nr:phosphoglycerate dehydrogenase [SAR202 cluster bacterium]|tara:strand:+ start:1111 stop:2703 length:1593 start_codon:yes stop_codon:yes gene_type:complete